jgi:hypothetical protein
MLPLIAVPQSVMPHESSRTMVQSALELHGMELYFIASWLCVDR